MGLLSELLRRLPARVRDQDEADAAGVAASPDPANGRGRDTSVRKLLAQAQAEALDAFRRAGLPDTPGVFGFNPETSTWVLLGTEDSPAARWGHVLEHPPQAGWRYASLSQIGRRERPEDPVVALAADLLDQITAAVARLDGDSGVDASGRHDLEVAFELTMTWVRLVEAVSMPAEPPTSPVEAPRRKAARKPRKPRSS